MNVQTIIDNYDKIDKGVRIFTFTYLFVFALIVFSAALDVIELDKPSLYTYDVDYGVESMIMHGELTLCGCIILLPAIFIMPFDKFNNFYGLFKMAVYTVILSTSLLFISGDASYFEEFGYAIESAAFMCRYIDSVFKIFLIVCVAIPIISRYAEQLKTKRRTNVK